MTRNKQLYTTAPLPPAGGDVVSSPSGQSSIPLNEEKSDFQLL